MNSIPTQNYIEQQLADIKASIMEQQRKSGGCEFHLGAALNALSSFLRRTIARKKDGIWIPSPRCPTRHAATVASHHWRHSSFMTNYWPW